MTEKELLTFEEADTAAKFANALYAADRYGYWSPFLSNQLLQGLNNNAKQPQAENVRNALADYKNQANDLRAYMEFTQVWDMIFARTVQSYVNALSFDLQVVCTNAYDKSEYESSEYKADKKIVNDFLNKFNYKKEFRQVVQQVMLNEVYFTWFRKTKWNNKGMKYALQALPQERCLLTGYWEKGMLFD